MGGESGRFRTTHWTELHNARTLDVSRQRQTVNNLIKSYWKPIYCFLRRRGYANELAKDLTQGFFHEVVLGRDLFQRADQTKGRFRTFLLAALKRYATDCHNKQTAGKRAPEGEIVTLDTAEMADFLESQSELEPDQLFYHLWASQILNQVLTEVKDNCYRSGQEKHWQVFHAKVVVPVMDSAEPPALKDLCAQYGIEDETTASNMILTVKRQFRSAMKRQLRQFVESDAEVEDELREVLGILSKGTAR
jgi:RNA polymerase sigma-70 factor (ECF subfamily)